MPVPRKKASRPKPRAATPLSPDGFLERLPVARRAEAERLRALIRERLPLGYEEAVVKDMLVYQVPLERYPDTYNRHPLWYIALASEKSYLSLHLMSIYGDRDVGLRLERAFAAAGKKLNMGKACIRFTSADDLELDAVGDAIASMPVDRWIAIAKAARRR